MDRALLDKPSGKWELDQLNHLYQIRPDLVNAAIRRLMSDDAELRWALVVSAYLNRQINLGKAAELLSMHEMELRERFSKLGIPLRIGSDDLDQAQAEVHAVLNWFSSSLGSK